MKLLTTTALGLALAAAGAAAQTEPTGQQTIDAGVIALSDWSYDTLYSGDSWSVEELFGTDVHGADGEDIGDVEDLVIDADGRVVALIAEVGGFWDIGDTHASIPWNEVEVAIGDRVAVPITEDTVDDYDIFGFSGLVTDNLEGQVVSGVDDEPLGPGLWRASELIGDYARINADTTGEGRLNYGYVSDLLIRDGQIAATVVEATGAFGRGYYAYPYTPTGPGYPANWTPRAATYDMPFLEGEVRSMERFDYDRIGDG